MLRSGTREAGGPAGETGARVKLRGSDAPHDLPQRRRGDCHVREEKRCTSQRKKHNSGVSSSAAVLRGAEQPELLSGR